MTKKILGICGTQKTEGFSSSEFLLNEALGAAEKEGAEVKLVRLRDYNILTCQGCGSCMDNRHCPLLNDPNDQLSLLYDECCAADAFIFSSPVYALSLPSIWKNWIDRCEPCEESDLTYNNYCYDVVNTVKGKAFRGKTAAQIVVAAGPGHEWAMSSLMPAFTAVKLSVIASVGLSLIEYDAQPGVKNKPWAKDIHEADFAIDISRSVGKRVCEAIGYSTFNIDYNKNATGLNGADIDSLTLGRSDGKPVNIGKLASRNLLLVLSGKDSSKEAAIVMERLQKQYGAKAGVGISSVSIVGRLPHFISKEYVVKQAVRKMGEACLFDWDMKFSGRLGIHESATTVVMIDTQKDRINFVKPICYNEKNFEELVKVINCNLSST